MRYQEFIFETAEENQIINLIAKAAAESVGNIVRRKIPDFDSQDQTDYSSLSDAGYPIQDMKIPDTESPAIKRTLDNLKIIIEYEPHSLKDGLDMGGYAPESHAIILNIPDIKSYSQHKNKNFDDILRQTLAHEIQHAVDKVKSNGKALKHPAHLSSDDYQGYLNLPAEINARFTEALLDISRVFANWKKQGVEISTGDLTKLLKQKFKDNRLDQLEINQLKRLYGRAYQFYQAEMNSPKSIEPSNLVTRAKNWITGNRTTGRIR